MGLITMCGGTPVSYEEVKAVLTPAATDTYFPVAHHHQIDLLKEEAAVLLPSMPLVSEAYGLNRDGKQFFGVLGFQGESNESSLMIGARGAHDHSMSRQYCAGKRITVCDNMIFEGSDSNFAIVRKHTRNIWGDLVKAVREALRLAPATYDRLLQDTAAMKARSCSEDRGAELIGRAMYKGLLTPTQATVVIGDWQNVGTENVRHEEFNQRTAWGLHNCFTEGLKKGGVNTVIERHGNVHDFFRQNFWLPEAITVPVTRA